MVSIASVLSENTYPGRGILMGSLGGQAVIAGEAAGAGLVPTSGLGFLK